MPPQVHICNGPAGESMLAREYLLTLTASRRLYRMNRTDNGSYSGTTGHTVGRDIHRDNGTYTGTTGHTVGQRDIHRDNGSYSGTTGHTPGQRDIHRMSALQAMLHIACRGTKIN